MGIIEALVGIFGSNIGGSLIGWIGGWLNRREDYKVKVIEIEDKKNQRAHDLAARRIDIEIMEKELAGKERIAVIQQETEETKSAYSALAESFKHDASLKGSPVVESLRAATRPVLTAWFALIACVQAAFVIWMGFKVYNIQFSASEVYELTKYSLMWVFFQAGVCIGWWFATRSTSSAPPNPKI